MGEINLEAFPHFLSKKSRAGQSAQNQQTPDLRPITAFQH